MSMLVLQTGVFVVAVLLTGILISLASRVHLLDRPVARSAHNTPTPVGGGLTIVLLFAVICAYYYVDELLSRAQFLALAGGLGIALMGLIDDLRRLDIRWRMPIQFAASIWAVWCLGGTPVIDFGLFSLEQEWLLNSLAVVALVWLLNLYNFMDGIDGLAGSELVFVNVMSLFLVINSGDEVIALLSAILLGAGAGFLLWNWPPAKIFMGDVGSGFIGFTLGVMALISMHQGSMTVWSWIILLAVFIVDATITLLRRYLSRQKWYEGHASHAYQNAARQYKSHGKVTITVIVINCLWLAPLAWLSVQRPQLGFLLSILAMTPLCIVALKLKAGKLMDVSLRPQSQ